eukprot:9753133-Karenia_brevis.AAC.1
MLFALRYDFGNSEDSHEGLQFSGVASTCGRLAAPGHASPVWALTGAYNGGAVLQVAAPYMGFDEYWDLHH